MVDVQSHPAVLGPTADIPDQPGLSQDWLHTRFLPPPPAGYVEIGWAGIPQEVLERLPHGYRIVAGPRATDPVSGRVGPMAIPDDFKPVGRSPVIVASALIGLVILGVMAAIWIGPHLGAAGSCGGP
jgi:hypothetical protein